MNNNSFSTYRSFNNLQDLKSFTSILDEYKIKYSFEDNSETFDPTFSNNELNKDYRLKLLPNDFNKANNLLEKHYSKDLDSISKDYYLFDFSDEELMEVIIKYDEWSILDYVLAQKLLKERGKEINPELIDILKKQRINELAKNDENSNLWISSGYLFAILGGFIGFWIGFIIFSSKKTLPNGEKVYSFSKKDRFHGKIIMIIASVMFPLSLFIKLNKDYF